MSKKQFSPQEAIATVNRFIELTKDIDARHKELYDRVGKYDRETSDIVHDIEFSTFTAKEGNLKARTLQKVRQLRRAAKDELEYITAIRDFYGKQISSIDEDLNSLLNKLQNIQNQQSNRTYKPREKSVTILTEEDD